MLAESSAVDLARHPFFTRWMDPQSGIESFILTERVAPVQQVFYFVNPGVSPDERWLWFSVSFPPSPVKMLAVVSLDPDQPSIRYFPGATFDSASPRVAPDSASAYFTQENVVWRQPLEGDPEVVCTLSPEYINHRPLSRLTTHLTLSADGKYFLLDGDFTSHLWFVALGEIATGEVHVLHEFPRCYNHAQFSPTDPDLFLIAQDWWRDPISGQYFCYDHRIWLMDIQQTRLEPIRPRDWYGHGMEERQPYGRGTLASHEWWSADGRCINWCDYGQGIFEYDIVEGVTNHIWRTPLCHGHSDPTYRYWCADQSPYLWSEQPCQVRFFDRAREREINIASALPLPPIPRGKYHIDPHPHFSPKGTWVTYTTTALGNVDVALTPVADCLAKMA
jgi:hypothetical protein